MLKDGPVQDGEEGVLAYLRKRARSVDPRPFFLVIGLVNPHDVLFYPAQFNASGYSPALLEGPVDVPATYFESLATKPAVQEQWVRFNLATGGAPADVVQARKYVNFYANLVKQTDAYLNTTLNLLDELGLTDDTVVIKTADHGEMAMSHQGQIQKMFNMYEQSLRVPLVISNPKLYPRPLQSDALVSHVDMVPTLATLMGTPPALVAAAGWQGVSYADAVVQPERFTTPQDEIVFLFDDFQFGQPAYPGFPGPQTHIVALVEARWKFAMYYDPKGVYPSEYEMYDLWTDPREVVNLAWPGANVTAEQRAQRTRLAAKLQRVIDVRLAPRLGVEWQLDITSTSMAALDRTALSVSVGGGAQGPPIGGAPLSQPGSNAEATFTPVAGGGCLDVTTGAGGPPCVADVDWSVLSGAGTMLGSARVVCSPTGAGGATCDGRAAVQAGTVSFRGLRAEGLRFRATVPSNAGGNGSLAIQGVAMTATQEAA